MKYTESIRIEAPRDEIVPLFFDTAHMARWQQGLLRAEPLEGTPGEPGARTRLVFRMGRRDMDMIETLAARDGNARLDLDYAAPGMTNRNASLFHDEDGGTLWEMTCEFIPETLMLKLMTRLAPGMFRRQTVKNMRAFKEFAENR